MRIVVIAVVLVLAGCTSPAAAPGEGVSREVPDDRSRSVAEVQVETAMASLWERPALHADIVVADADVPRTALVELDTTSGRWRAQSGDDVIESIDDAADPRVARALAWVTSSGTIDYLDWSGAHELLTVRAGRYGLEDGHRLAAPGADTVEVWLSRDTGLVTDVVLPRDGVTVAFTPLPAPLVIAG